jgi:catechol 2,3-dioxygenase-like lactoylglutathione lyase family enzyme
MKFEIVVIPVSDVDRAKEFYGRLGWRLDADYDSGKDFRVIQFTPRGSGCSIIFGKNVTPAAPGSVQGMYLIVSDIQAARKELLDRGVEISEVFHDAAGVYEGPDEPYLFGRVRVSGPDASIAAPGRSLRSVIRTATAGCSRKSRRGCPVASTLRRRLSRRRTIWRARFGVRRPHTASTKSAPAANVTKTGPTGTPSTWCASRPAKSCRNERLERDRHRRRARRIASVLWPKACVSRS